MDKQDNDHILVSRMPDNNIFHILYDLMMYYHESITDVYIYNNTHNPIDIENPCQKWRRFVIERIFKTEIKYTNELFIYNSPKRQQFNHIHYLKNEASPILLTMLKNIIPQNQGKYILINQRHENNRYMYDTSTGEPIHYFLGKYNFGIPLRYCCFDDMRPEEQYEICSNAAIFISMHGAACTNIIFTPISTPLIEINLRKCWYCDPVCDAHFNQEIPFDVKCNGSLIHSNYHKADFHNLCGLLGKPYYEFTPDKYSGRFRDRNPISKENIHVDGIYLIGLIKNVLNKIKEK